MQGFRLQVSVISNLSPGDWILPSAFCIQLPVRVRIAKEGN